MQSAWMNPPAYMQDDPINGSPDPETLQLINTEAERATLGSLLIDPDRYYEVSNILLPVDFYRQNHKALYSAIERLFDDERPVDFTTIMDEMDRAGDLEKAGGPAFITDLLTNTPTGAYAAHYASIVYDLAARRRALYVAGKLAQDAYDMELGIDDIIGRGHEYLDTMIARQHADDHVTKLPTALQDALSGLDERCKTVTEGKTPGMLFGYPALDRVLGGLMGGDLVVVAGAPGMGKSQLALNFLVRAAKAGIAGGLISLEMSNDQVMQRILAMTSGVSLTKIRSGRVEPDEWLYIMNVASEIRRLPVWLADADAVSVGAIRALARRKNRQGECDVLVIDYLQLMDDDTQQNRTVAISNISRGLKRLARQLSIPIMALSQLNRRVDSTADKRPTLTHLRDSGSIGQDADIVLFPWSEYYYNDSADPNLLECIIGKNRQGATGTAPLYFQRDTGSIRPVEIQRTYVDPYYDPEGEIEKVFA